MDDQCETCGGEGVLVGDGVGRRGEREDVVEQCPDCGSDDYDDGRDQREQRRFDQAAEEYERRLDAVFGPGFLAEVA